MLDCLDVGKWYGKIPALHGVSLRLAAGEILGFLGPNGAGKTTLIKIILGLATPTGGVVRVDGADVFSQRRVAMRTVGAVVEAPVFFEYLSAYENLRHLTALTAPVPRARLLETLELVGLGAVAQRRVQTFSYGMKQRLGIAQALLPDTRLLILDEPTNGLDPHGIASVRTLVRDLARNRGLAVFISSHLLTEVEQVCDRFVIIHRGRKVHEGGADELRAEADEVDIVWQRDAALEGAVRGHPCFLHLHPAADGPTLVGGFKASAADIPDLVAWLVGRGARVVEVRRRRRTLEELFVEKTATGADDVRTDAF